MSSQARKKPLPHAELPKDISIGLRNDRIVEAKINHTYQPIGIVVQVGQRIFDGKLPVIRRRVVAGKPLKRTFSLEINLESFTHSIDRDHPLQGFGQQRYVDVVPKARELLRAFCGRRRFRIVQWLNDYPELQVVVERI